jgi:regulator of protease activity HflC (stomatin/prohibitin superfamily)
MELVGLIPLIVVILIVLWTAIRIVPEYQRMVVLGLQYLDALRALGTSPATKIVFPLEFTTLLRPFVGGAIAGEGSGAR